jgi:hypothetical protein
MNFALSFLFYGLIGINIEVFFTGIKSLLNKDWRGTGTTYVHMFWIYAIGGFLLSKIAENFSFSSNIYANAILMAALLYVPIIYAIELTSGLVLKRILGKIPWEYPPGPYTFRGLIRLDYCFYWFGLAILFQPLAIFVKKVVDFLIGA